MDYYLPPFLSIITPLPHLVLPASFEGNHINITLDSGANVAFISMRCVTRLGLPIMPNGQLTQLAIPKYRDTSKGEVDFTVTEGTTGTAQLRIRALILLELSCEIYGGQTFHHDNGIVANISKSTVSLHDGVFVIQLPHHNRERHPPASIYKPIACSSSAVPLPIQKGPKSVPSLSPSPSGEPILMKDAQSLLPNGTYSIPLQRASLAASVLILPPTPKPNSPCQQAWNPQVCWLGESL